MSDKPSEYLKRTCLICGCHTNQTINIYEPRSGPNIVQLIQAKFKFQPLNEDKYLCFSCNNWLINWHSLQVLNSNDGESPSGTFRPQMNGMVQEERAKPSHQQQQQQTQKPNARPIAQVRPLQLSASANTLPDAVNPPLKSHTTANALQNASNISLANTKTSSAKPKPPPFHHTRMRRCRSHKALQRSCITCQHSVMMRQRRKERSCRKCSKSSKQHPESLATKALVTVAAASNSLNHQSQQQQQQQQSIQTLKRPLVDGKVVAMLRRLGTTLSREQMDSGSASVALPPIMSPAKPKPRWTRRLDDDEILLNFNTAISEVLPHVLRAQTESAEEPVVVKQARRKLEYQISEEEADFPMFAALRTKGLSISIA